MNITEHEMRGLLTGKCLPGDMRVNEELPVYLVRKFAELKAERDVLAAENAALKAACKTIANSEAYEGDSFVCDFDTLVSVAAGALKTPATDAYLNSVRAEGVEMLLASLPPHYTARADIEQFAAQLRTGKDGE